MNRTSNWMVTLCLLVFIVLSISSCGKATVTTVGTSTKTLAATSTRQGQKISPARGGSAFGTPTVYAHESILADNSTVYVGSSKGTLTALNASSGAVNWQKSLGSTIYVASIAGSTVIASSENTVYAFDTKSGNQMWSKQVARMASAGVRSANSIVYVESAILNSSYTISALRITNGSQLWQYTASAFTPDFLGVANGTAYVVEMSGSSLERINQSLTALRVGDGKVLWHVPLKNAGGLARALAVATNGTLYLTTTYGSVIALHGSTGALLWQHMTQGMTPEGVGDAFPVAVANGVVYANDTRETLALRATDGYVLWKKGYTGTPSVPFIVQPIVDDGIVYTAGRNEPIQALRAGDGTEVWQNKDAVAAEPLIVQAGLLYVNASNTLYAFHVQDGKVVWRQAIQYPDGLGPEVHEAITSEDVSLGQTNGMVQTFNAVNGAVRWSRMV